MSEEWREFPIHDRGDIMLRKGHTRLLMDFKLRRCSDLPTEADHERAVTVLRAWLLKKLNEDKPLDAVLGSGVAREAKRCEVNQIPDKKKARKCLACGGEMQNAFDPVGCFCSAHCVTIGPLSETERAAIKASGFFHEERRCEMGEYQYPSGAVRIALPCGEGLSLRDFFAGLALTKDQFISDDPAMWAHQAHRAYALADAMLAERERKPEREAKA